MITTFKLFEEQEANIDEYYDAVSLHYDDNLLNMIKQGDQMALRMTPSRKAITKKSDSGNLLINYCEGNKLLIILGAVTLSGKMNREDISDMNIWLNYAISKIENDYTVYTSPNELSEPLVKKLIKMCENKGIDLDVNIENINIPNQNNLTWKNYIIKQK